jgi:uncharacterized spore protein YtfJ
VTNNLTADRPATVTPGERADQRIRQLVEKSGVNAVFGQPIEKGNMIVVPCAEVFMGLGIGGGTGTGPATERGPMGQGEGLGGGGGTRSRPVAALVVTEKGVQAVPIVDATRVALAALTTAGFAFFWLARLSRAARRRPRLPAFNRPA